VAQPPLLQFAFPTTASFFFFRLAVPAILILEVEQQKEERGTIFKKASKGILEPFRVGRGDNKMGQAHLDISQCLLQK
jgi:hypothetical protein